MMMVKGVSVVSLVSDAIQPIRFDTFCTALYLVTD